MKKARKSTDEKAKAENVTKSVSMPREFWLRVEARVSTDPELDFSKYVRRLIRRDVEAA